MVEKWCRGNEASGHLRRLSICGLFPSTQVLRDFVATIQIAMSELPADDVVADESSGSALAGTEMVRIGRYSITYEAELRAAVLNAEGIRTEIFGANINAVDWLWQGFNPVDLLVPRADAERAGEILARTAGDDLEPAAVAEGAAEPVDERGNKLLPVGAYENVHDLLDAQTVLASAGVRAFAPAMKPRGDRPAGVGKRFVLRVPEGEVAQARAMLAEEASEDRDDPRCPKCGSWRVYLPETLLGGMAHLVGIGHGPMAECLACHYRADAAEFGARG
jgi:hypothetical protein